LSSSNAINARRALLQLVHTDITALTEAAANIPIDDTIPQNDEGTEIVATTIVPTYSTSLLEVVFYGFGAYPNTPCALALFRDNGVDALDATVVDIGAGDGQIIFYMAHYVLSGSKDSTTFKIRAGPGSGNKPIVFNGTNPNAPARLFGGVSDFHLTVREYYQEP
jgi:hypothetical protein